MIDKRMYRLDVYVVAFAVIFATVYLGWQMTHSGVVSHHLLDQRSLPAISNWWGLAILPLIGWLAAWSVQRRSAVDAAALTKAACAVLGTLLVGVALSVSFVVDSHGNASTYIFFGALASGLVWRTYRAEYVFGFVMGMSIVFGLVLPAIVALFAVAISAAFHLLLRPAFAWTMSRVRC